MPSEIKVLFNILDVDQSGEIAYDEFLREIRGDMNDARKRLVNQAFSKLDLDNSGVIDFDEIKKLYNCKKHLDMTNAWKLGERPVYEGKKARRNDDSSKSYTNYSNRGKTAVPASKTTPWGVSDGKTDYTKSSNPNENQLQSEKEDQNQC